MNIIFWSFYNPLGDGGFEKQAIETARAFVSSGHNLGCFSTAANAEAGAELALALEGTGLFQLGVRVVPSPFRAVTIRSALRFWISRQPTRILAAALGPFQREFAAELRLARDAWQIDFIYALSLRSLYFLPLELQLPIVADLVDCYTLKFERLLAFQIRYRMRRLPGALVQWLKTRRIERDVGRRLAASADFVFVSPADAAKFARLVPCARTHHVPIAIARRAPADPNPQKAGAPVFVFYGHLYTEFNLDAVLTLINGVMPRIRATIPAASLHITGIRPPAVIRRLVEENDWLVLVPEVTDLACFVRPAAVMCWPFRYGSGIKTKILESLLLGKPVVTTERGAEPFTLQQRQALVIGNTSASLADAAVGLLLDPARSQELGEAGRRMVLRDFAPELRATRLIALAKANIHSREQAESADASGGRT